MSSERWSTAFTKGVIHRSSRSFSPYPPRTGLVESILPRRGWLEDRRAHLRAWDAVLDGHLERVLLDVEELHRPPALKQRRLHTDGQAQSPFTIVRVTNQLRDLENRGGMLIDLTRTSGGGRPTDGFQGPVQRRIGRVTLASSSSRMLPSLNFLSVRISRDIFSTFSLILEAVSSFSALAAVAYLPDEGQESGSISDNSEA